MNIIDPTTLALVGKALDLAALRHAVHAQNIANAHALDYAPTRVRFEDQLDALRQTLADGGSVDPAEVATLPLTLETAAAGTRVELDEEVAALSLNTLNYQALVRALDRQLAMMSLVVSDGRR